MLHHYVRSIVVHLQPTRKQSLFGQHIQMHHIGLIIMLVPILPQLLHSLHFAPNSTSASINHYLTHPFNLLIYNFVFVAMANRNYPDLYPLTCDCLGMFAHKQTRHCIISMRIPRGNEENFHILMRNEE